MELDLFLILLISSAIITITLTEGMKRLLVATETPHRDNVVAWISSITASTGVGVIYRIPFGLGFSVEQLLRLFALIFCTWLTSMLLYDKIVQTVDQNRRYKGGKNNV